MEGPTIFAQTLGKPVARGGGVTEWQYHSRSDLHSKQACWTILFDLLRACDVFRDHVEQHKITFAVNHVMVGKIAKKLDLVVCRIPGNRERKPGRSFAEFGNELGIVLSTKQQALLAKLPEFHEEQADEMAEVVVALEAKACMTEHVKAIPRLFAEILATGYLAKQAAPNCVTASHTVVNAAPFFRSPGSEKETKHNATAPEAVVRMLGDALPTAQQAPTLGYDAVGVTVVSCRNNGSPVEVVTGPPAPTSKQHHNYDRMIHTICAAYRAKFGR